ncbi:MAG: AraC family transcriptional regulator [Flavobacteriaceae bacterium]|nr:AraC family transcriptional regulator [Flavobacteriaceae bacterium]
MKFKDLQECHKLIECENIEIAAYFEVHKKDYTPILKEYYNPSSLLIYVEQGILDINFENKLYTFPKGSFCFARKYTNVFATKRFLETEQQAKTYTFIMPDVFLRKIIDKFKFEKSLQPIEERIFKLAPTKKLLGVIDTIKNAIEKDQDIDTEVLETKIIESLKAIISTNPKLAILFKEFSLAKRADLTLFMRNNFMMKVPLEEFAKITGRSLSTFTREFKIVFGTTPHKWILKKRLQAAYKILSETSKKISDVYVETGFEDMAHFSKVFKKEFGFSPSEIKNKISN